MKDYIISKNCVEDQLKMSLKNKEREDYLIIMERPRKTIKNTLRGLFLMEK